jgi:hypothetical protein
MLALSNPLCLFRAMVSAGGQWPRRQAHHQGQALRQVLWQGTACRLVRMHRTQTHTTTRTIINLHMCEPAAKSDASALTEHSLPTSFAHTPTACSLRSALAFSSLSSLVSLC